MARKRWKRRGGEGDGGSCFSGSEDLAEVALDFWAEVDEEEVRKANLTLFFLGSLDLCEFVFPFYESFRDQKTSSSTRRSKRQKQEKRTSPPRTGIPGARFSTEVVPTAVLHGSNPSHGQTCSLLTLSISIPSALRNCESGPLTIAKGIFVVPSCCC